MEKLLLDSSVVVKWFSEEEKTREVVEIRDAHVKGRVEILVTPLLLCEIANALRYKPDYDLQRLRKAVSALYGLHLVVEEIDEELLARAGQIALEAGVTVYDALPVARAEGHQTICITADEQTQYNRLKGKYPVELL